MKDMETCALKKEFITKSSEKRNTMPCRVMWGSTSSSQEAEGGPASIVGFIGRSSKGSVCLGLHYFRGPWAVRLIVKYVALR